MTTKNINLAEEQPTWLCHTCGTTYGLWPPGPLPVVEYHTSMCDVCFAHDVRVTSPQHFGWLVTGWQKYLSSTPDDVI